LKDGVTAGPPPTGVNTWLVKWRGTFEEPEDRYVFKRERPPTDQMTTSIMFKRGEEGEMVLSGVLCKGCFVVPYKGVRIGDTPARGPKDSSVEELWESKK